MHARPEGGSVGRGMDFSPIDIEVAITDLGNLAVVAPAAVLVWVWLAWHRGWRAAIRFQWPVATTFIVTVALKMVSREAGPSLLGTPLELSTGAPSGHMAMATVVYGGVALMLLRRGLEPISLLMVLLVVATLTGVAVTRVSLHAHMPADVAAGLLIGGLCAVWAGRVAAVPAGETVRDAAQLVMLLVGIVLLMQLSGLRFDSADVL
jgi:membrane-associated phospholipid phosphatase